MNNRYFFNSLSPTGIGINPLDLNPYIYFQTYNPLFLTPTNPNLGDSITEIYRYNDSSYIASGDTGCVGTWSNLNGKGMIYMPAIYGGCWPPPCTGSCEVATYYTTNQNISFMSLSGYEYTIYFVGKPLSGESGNDGHIFSDLDFIYSPGPPGVPRSEYLYVKDNKDVYLKVVKGGISPATTTIFDLPIEINSSEGDLESKGLRIFSVRAKDTFDTVTSAATSYINGIQTTAITQSNLSLNTTLSSNTTLIGMGALDNFVYRLYQGYFAELIIFNTIHNDATHNGVVDFLKNRWNIT